MSTRPIINNPNAENNKTLNITANKVDCDEVTCNDLSCDEITIGQGININDLSLETLDVSTDTDLNGNTDISGTVRIKNNVIPDGIVNNPDFVLTNADGFGALEWKDPSQNSFFNHGSYMPNFTTVDGLIDDYAILNGGFIYTQVGKILTISGNFSATNESIAGTFRISHPPGFEYSQISAKPFNGSCIGSSTGLVGVSYDNNQLIMTNTYSQFSLKTVNTVPLTLNPQVGTRYQVNIVYELPDLI